MARNGKIARLPRVVRDEVNRRLEDGEPGPALLAWLNGREDVQAVLKAQFAGRAINKQNLSEWRRGEFQDWRRRQESLGMARELMEQMEEIREVTQGQFLSDEVADMAALLLARVVRGAGRLKDVHEQSRAVLAIIPEVVRLRASDREYEQAQREMEIHRRQGTGDGRVKKVGGEPKAESGGLSPGRAGVGVGQTGSGLIEFRPPLGRAFENAAGAKEAG